MEDKQHHQQNGIYRIRFIDNDTVYVGSTSVSFLRRRSQHLYNLHLNKHVNPHLQYAFNLYGLAAFAFDVIEVVEDTTLLHAREQHWIDWYRSQGKVYNVLMDAGQGRRGKRGELFTDERKANLRIKLTGRTLAPEHAQKLREYWTPEARAEQSARKRGRRYSNEARTRMSFARYGNTNAKGKTRKTYEGFIAPDGNSYRDIANLPAFAEQHHIQGKRLVELDSGRVLSYKGWKRITPVRTAQRTKWFAFIAPDGTRYEGITNLKKFCGAHGLLLSCMALVHAGKQKQHQGWAKG